MRFQSRYLSLTVVNWNGFFARTLELDPLVTTLSGGNGSGKSTLMAACLVALIPDLNLLHFRNTTEAGASTACADRGLHGKLSVGDCYSLLKVRTAPDETTLIGVRLRQLVGREGKVELKPLVVKNLPIDLDPLTCLTRPTDDPRVVEICPLNQVSQHLQSHGCLLTLPPSVAQYHQLLFELGILPKPLRAPTDRFQFYKLLEASLYGGLSSTITRTLKSYLLPAQLGIHRAFKDLEGVVQENRLTLSLLAQTQSQRDYFKQLITAATQYVSTECMRQRNHFQTQLQSALDQRKDSFSIQNAIATAQDNLNVQEKERQNQVNRIEQLQKEHDLLLQHHYQLEQFQSEEKRLGPLQRTRIAAETQWEQSTLKQAAQDQIHASLTQALDKQVQLIQAKQLELADQQAALNAQQVRLVQHQQALELLNAIRQRLEQPTLTIEAVPAQCQQLEQQLQHEVLPRLMRLTQQIETERLNCASYANRLKQLRQLQMSLPERKEMPDHPARLFEKLTEVHEEAQLASRQLPHLETALAYHEQNYLTAQRAWQDWEQLQQTEYWQNIAPTAIPEQLAQLETERDRLGAHAQQCEQEHLACREQLTSSLAQQQSLKEKLPLWFQSQVLQAKLEAAHNLPLKDRAQLIQALQKIRRERQACHSQLESSQKKLDAVKAKVLSVGVLSDGRDTNPELRALADALGGETLETYYDQIDEDQAQKLSALLAPFQETIVVDNIASARKHFAQCIGHASGDFYLIARHALQTPSLFFTAVTDSENELWVSYNSDCWRYHRKPTGVWLGYGARQKQLEQLSAEQTRLADQHLEYQKQYQTAQQALEALETFELQRADLGFTSDVEKEYQQSVGLSRTLEQRLAQCAVEKGSIDRQIRSLEKSCRSGQALLPQLLYLSHPIAHYFAQRQQAQQVHTQALAWARWLAQQGTRIPMILQGGVNAFNPDGEVRLTQLQSDYAKIEATRNALTQQIFDLKDLLNRSDHLRSEHVDLCHADPIQQPNLLKQALEKLQQEHQALKASVAESQRALHQLQQTALRAQTEYQTQCSLEKQLSERIAALAQPLRSARWGVDLNYVEMEINQFKKQLQAEQAGLIKCVERMAAQQQVCQQQKGQLSTLRTQYQLQRQTCLLLHSTFKQMLSKVAAEKLTELLYPASLRYEAESALREQSDQALGTLRGIVTRDEPLRLALRSCEESRSPQKKVDFYLFVVQHLREQIRQDIFHTQEPIEAIEAMDRELERLKSELEKREDKLCINTKSIAGLIQKAYHREQARIQLLNDQLRAVHFGEIRAVRLKMNLRSAHQKLLEALEGADEFFKQGNSKERSFTEMLGKLYQQWTDTSGMVTSSLEQLGESLLDYRNYLDLHVEVLRQGTRWLKAESGALSTGEAIGTGMAVLMVVMQSWEAQGQPWRAPHYKPCRLLFLDEAARLDGQSIETLFELCQRLTMQIVLAAPEYLQTEQGTLYRLNRFSVDGRPHVQIAGLRFLDKKVTTETLLPEVAYETEEMGMDVGRIAPPTCWSVSLTARPEDNLSQT